MAFVERRIGDRRILARAGWPQKSDAPVTLFFQYPEDAERVLDVLAKRFAKQGLTLHPEKTRLPAFARSALSSSPDAPSCSREPAKRNAETLRGSAGRFIDGLAAILQSYNPAILQSDRR